jgi:hypothetical protein
MLADNRGANPVWDVDRTALPPDAGAFSGSMPEVPASCQNHRHAVFVARFGRVIISF